MRTPQPDQSDPDASPAATSGTLYPQSAAFLAGASYARSIPTVPDIATVLGDFNQQLQGLPSTDPKQILNRVQSALQSILNK